jgi:hypothetical protein
MEGKMAQRKFEYYLKLKDGRLLHAQGTSVEEAARAAGVSMAGVKRHMPVRALLTPAEIEARAKRFAALRAKDQTSQEDTEER